MQRKPEEGAVMPLVQFRKRVSIAATRQPDQGNIIGIRLHVLLLPRQGEKFHWEHQSLRNVQRESTLYRGEERSPC